MLTEQPRVLVTDDEDLVRRIVCQALMRRGFHVLEARSSEEALAIIAADPHIDLLVTDIVMPGMHGHVLAAKVAEQNPHIRVLFMSGYADEATLRDIPEDQFLPKPFTPSQLIAKVRERLDQAAV